MNQWHDRGPWEKIEALWKQIEATHQRRDRERVTCPQCGCGVGAADGIPVWHTLASGEDKRATLCATCAGRGRAEGWVFPAPEEVDEW